MSYQWDPAKARRNQEKHGVRFADAVAVFMDDRAITVEDLFTAEEGFITLGMDALGRILVVVFTYRGDEIRLISARMATISERRQYESES
jgi:uncharacterized protein